MLRNLILDLPVVPCSANLDVKITFYPSDRLQASKRAQTTEMTSKTHNFYSVNKTAGVIEFWKQLIMRDFSDLARWPGPPDATLM